MSWGRILEHAICCIVSTLFRRREQSPFTYILVCYIHYYSPTFMVLDGDLRETCGTPYTINQLDDRGAYN